MLTQEMESPKYARFNVSVVTFKKAYGHNIEAYVLVPKNITSGKHPLLVKIHGGGFVSFPLFVLFFVFTEDILIGVQEWLLS